MTETDRLGALFAESSPNAVLSWLLVAVLGGALVGGGVFDRYEPMLFSVVAISIIVAPAVKFRDPTVMPPWYFIGLICLPVLWEAFVPHVFVMPIVPSLALATLGLLIAVELHRFTVLHMVPWFAVVLIVLFTLAMAGLLNILRWSSDVLLGTTYLLDGRTQDAINAAVMVEFIYVTIAGLVAGAIFYRYFQRMASRPNGRMAVASVPQIDGAENVEGVVLSTELGISGKRQSRLVRLFQVVLVGIMIYGVWTRRIPVVTNSSLAFGITFLPAILEREYDIAIEPGLAIWVTSAVLLHTLGTVGLYDVIAPWDHLTHTLSATVVAAAGYATLRAIHLHADSIHLPRWALFVFTLVFVLAIGVIWELLEFFIDQGALVLGMEPVLAQHGINDSIVDMLFNLTGAIIVATWGTVYLSAVSESLANQLEKRFGTR